MPRDPRPLKFGAWLGVVAVSLLAACAWASELAPLMTPARVEEILRADTVKDLTLVDGQLRFSFAGVRMACVMDRKLDRLRMMAPVVRSDIRRASGWGEDVCRRTQRRPSRRSPRSA